ncbi:hypothetical protein LG943_04945 [Streptomonospora sp. S1-112]|uniref:Uncharacterized protein n=1 Tax=Streptomonospora mangrovi TaxID=2883123 RepID=A0A9X3SLT6_9ACTN|nr:hypothetical protein [Streptomonospora mangrovi]MDA0563681.1 hypothetical protein [Streptomonospora mangrovi]
MARRRGEQDAAQTLQLAATLPEWAREMVLLGCHGGAGTTTLRVLLNTPWEFGAYSADRREIATFGRPLVLVTRDNAAATARAAEVVNNIEAGGLVPAAMVVVADGSGPEPPEATTRLRLVEARVGRLIRFPFVAGLRFVDVAEVGQVKLPKKAQQALDEIRNACFSAARGALARQVEES